MDLPILSIIVFLPIVSGMALLFFPPERRDLIYRFALVISFICFALSVLVYFGFDIGRLPLPVR